MRYLAFILLISLGYCPYAFSQECNSPVAEDVTVCSGTSAILTAFADPGEIQWYDEPTGGNQLAAGSRFETPPLTANTTYYVQLVSGNCTSARTAVSVVMRSGPNVSSATICAASGARLTASGSAQIFQWYESQNSQLVIHTGPFFETPVLNSSATYYVRQIFADGCVSPPTAGNVNVIQKPSPPIVSDITVCSGTSPTLSASGPGGLYQWFSTPTGGTPIITSPDFTTPPLTSSTTYYVQTNISGCISERVPVRITVNPIPPLPQVESQTICSGNTATLTASGPAGSSFIWYDVPSRGNPIGTGASFITPQLNRSTIFYVVASLNGCSSPRQPVTVTVNPVPPLPISPDRSICRGSSAVLVASGSDGTYNWYDQAEGGDILGTGAEFITAVLSIEATYFVEAVTNSCISGRNAVKVSVTDVPAQPRALDVTICSGATATLSVLDTGGTFEWYESQTGGFPLFTGSQFTTPSLTSNTVYFVQTVIAGCASPRTRVNVTVTQPPAAPIISGQAVCPGQPAALSISNPQGVIEWFDAAEGGTLLFTGQTFTTGPLAESAAFYAQSRMGDCVSARTAVTVSVRSAPDPSFRYLSGTYCRTARNPRPQVFDPAGGRFTVEPAGLIFVSTTTGEINMSVSAIGSYLVTFTSNGLCPFTSSRPIHITDSPNPAFSLEGPYCQGAANPTATYPTGGTGGTFSSSPAGLVFNSDYTIDLSSSRPGTYIVTNTIASNGSSCPTVSASDTIMILAALSTNAGEDQTAYPGTVINLSGSAPGSTSVNWTGGRGVFSQPNSLNTTYTPAEGEEDVLLTLHASGTPPCADAEDGILISYRLQPPAVSPAQVCFGQTAQLTAVGQAENYNWYDALSGGNLLYTGSTYTTPPLNSNTVYFVGSFYGSNRSPRTRVEVSVRPVPSTPRGQNASVCRGSAAVLNVIDEGADYLWYDSDTSMIRIGRGVRYTTQIMTNSHTFYVEAVRNGCASPRTALTVTVNQTPVITSRALEVICNRSALAYQITADQPGTTFLWRRDAVTGISNPAIEGQTTSLINETLVSTAEVPVSVTYLITPYLNGCQGAEFRYTVTVDPSAVVTSAASAAICNNTASNYEVTFNLPGTNFSWSRQSVAGISNAAISGQRSAVIREVLTNTSNLPVNVTYRIDHSFEGCPGVPFYFNVVVNPVPRITSAANVTVCSGVAQNYQISSNVAGATFVWSRSSINNISNPPVSGQTSAAISETLINTGTTPVTVVYTIVPTANGCEGAPFEYRVRVNPTPAAPLIAGSRQVCVGSSISLGAAQVQGASYRWAGPGGWVSTQRNNTIPNATKAQEGDYSLTITVNGCVSETSTAFIRVNLPPTADAGMSQTVCSEVPEIQLNGSTGGGTSTGIWTSSGGGSFLPSNKSLNARYIPTASERTAGRVILTLTSTSEDNCTPASSSTTVTLEPVPVVNAGSDRSVCSQDPLVSLGGSVTVTGEGTWSSNGSGSFVPSASALNAVYVPGSSDIIRGRVTLTLTATGSNTCLPVRDEMNVNIVPPPQVDIGPDIRLPLNRTVTLNPRVSYTDVQYFWHPATNLSSQTVQNPIAVGVEDITYTLRVTDSRGCVTEDQVYIDVLMPLVIPNTFTPNGDAVNDVWNIRELVTYPLNTVQVFNRYGETVFSSVGYTTPWDGTHKGQPAPVGTYYYIINAQFPGMVYSGYVTLLR